MPQRISPARHIFSFAQTLKGGGVERALLRMAGGWAAAGRQVTLVIGEARGALAHELPPGVTVHELGDPGYRALFGLPAIVEQAGPDVIFCPGNHYSGAAWWLRRRLGSTCPPIIGKVSNALERRDQSPLAAAGYRFWLHRHPGFLDAAVAMTPAMAQEAIRALRIAPARVHVIANPPALPIRDAPPPPMPTGRFVLGVGRLAPQKRWERLISALPQITDPNVKLLLLGEGESRAELALLIERLGLADRVMMPGHAPDPLPAIARASVVALTSDYEGVPGVVREAVTLGTPVVASDCSVSIPELIDSPARGSIVAPDDSAALVAALNHWLAPGRARPDPRPDTGPDPIAAYLALFDNLAAQRSA